jgi:hypothetical protein
MIAARNPLRTVVIQQKRDKINSVLKISAIVIIWMSLFVSPCS